MRNPTSIPLGVSDPKGMVGAFNRNRADIDQVDLLTGEIAQKWLGLGQVLMIDGDTLIGWQAVQVPYKIRLFKVDMALKNSDVEFSEIIELPEWVQLHSKTETESAIKFFVEDDAYVVFIKAQRKHPGGAPPQEDDEILPQSIARRIDIDIKTMKIRNHVEEDGFINEQQNAQRGEHLTRNAGGVVYRQAGKLHNAPWKIAEGERYLRGEGAPGQKEQLLSIIDGVEPESGFVGQLVGDQLDQIAPELSLDSQHLAVVKNEDKQAFWHIYNTRNGNLVFSIPYRNTMQDFRIFGNRLLYQDKKICYTDKTHIIIDNIVYSIDMKTNNNMWHYLVDKIVIDSTFLPMPNH